MANQYIFVLLLSDVFLSVRLHERGVRRDILEQFGKLLGISVPKGIRVGEQTGHMVLWTTMIFPDCAQFSISLLRTSHRPKQTSVDLFIPRGPSGFFQIAPWTDRGRERERISPSQPCSHPWALPKSRQEGSICHSWLAHCTSKLLGGSKSFPLTNIWRPWWRKSLGHRCSAVRSTSPSMPSVTPQEICSNVIFCLQNTLCFRNYPVPMLLWTGKLKELGGAPPKKSHEKREWIFRS